MDITELQWEGKKTIELARAAMERAEWIEIKLPANFNHTLFCHFRPNAIPGEVEQVEITGGAEILSSLAKVRLLEDFNNLVDTAASRQAELKLVSPSPRLVIKVPEKH